MNKSHAATHRQDIHRTSSYSAYCNRHKTAIAFSLQRMWLRPLSMWITLAVIAVALSLPTSMRILLNNLSQITNDKREIPTLTLFLQAQTSERQTKDFAEILIRKPAVLNVKPLFKDQALQDFNSITGIKNILQDLPENPLPHAIIITPDLSLLEKQGISIQAFAEGLKKDRLVEAVQLDVEWVHRLQAILRIAKRISWVIGVLLAIAVILIVGNAIRLEIENRKEEIHVNRLVGATNSYIRRPFLYGGAWLGLFGGIFSLIIVYAAFLWIIPPVQQLAQLYNSNFVLSTIDFPMLFEILILSTLLGWTGSFIIINQQLWSNPELQ